ncbi:MAG TPA: hypothetical protein VFM28_07990 [Nitrososphaeraceae archaeon]|nr:hypothetical protein [Nitrososphaeraceae archaeon]
MEDIIEIFAERLGIEPNAAKRGISITCRYFLQNSEPIKASGLLSMLPSSLTNLLSTEEKKKSRQIKKIFLLSKLLRRFLMNALMVISRKEKRYMKKQYF